MPLLPYYNMADTMTKQQRHDCMAAVKGKDTKPEMLVRRFLHGRGFRYGLHNKNLPGSPDIVLRRFKTVIFVHGCFWHGHEDCKYYRLPKSNIEFWQTKIDRNRTRDKRDIQALHELGWRVIVIWECQLKTEDLRTHTLQQLAESLNEAYSIQPSYFSSLAAEPEIEYDNNH